MAKDNNCLQPIAEILPGIVKREHKTLTPIQERLISMPLDGSNAINMTALWKTQWIESLIHGHFVAQAYSFDSYSFCR